jgi:hypothetical protein
MTEHELTSEEYAYIDATLEVLAHSDPSGPNEEEWRLYDSLIVLGCTEQWIAEEIAKRIPDHPAAAYRVVEVTPDDYGF